MVYKWENGHIVAPQPLSRSVDTWQDGATFTAESCPTICTMRRKMGFMGPDGSVSPLNHPLLVLNASCALTVTVSCPACLCSRLELTWTEFAFLYFTLCHLSLTSWLFDHELPFGNLLWIRFAVLQRFISTAFSLRAAYHKLASH